MTGSPRILTIMGSGETSPTMVKTHRDNVSRLAPRNPSCVILDTPFGFQENADDIATKAIEYFSVSINVDAEVASYRSNKMETLYQERFYAKIARADFIFAGPGSPSYALRHWRDTPVPKLLASKLASGPVVVTFSSAAALTLGSRTVPVYEIYKVGEDPDWIDGLDTLGSIGIRGAVIPHFNNAEGGSHDTRFCYLGEKRLEHMESKLKPEESVFGIDEHTAITIDLESGLVTVTGNGIFTIRNQGRQVTFESGSKLDLDSLIDTETLFRARTTAIDGENRVTATQDSSDGPLAQQEIPPFRITVDQLQTRFDRALEARDVDAATQTALSLQSEIERWQTETFQSDEMEQARTTLRSMILRLGELATKGVVEPKEIFAPFVELALELRARARNEKRWDESDRIRDALGALGIEVRDIPGGSEWNSIGKK